MQSFGWPACTTIFSNWFGKRGRGAIVGLWCSSGNAGNIGGALLTSFFTSTLLFNWKIAFMFVSWFCIGIALINCFVITVHPHEKGIYIEEIDDKLNETERLQVD